LLIKSNYIIIIVGGVEVGLFSKTKKSTPTIRKKLTTDYHTILRDLKKKRVEDCQRNDVSLSQMGKDLAHIERKAREFFNESVKYIKSGNSHEDAYMYILENYASSDNDRMILDKLFVNKK